MGEPTTRPRPLPAAVRAVFRRLRSPEGWRDPYPLYEELRARRDAGLDLGRVVVDHATAQAVLTDPNASSERVDAIGSGLDGQRRADAARMVETLEDVIAFRDPPQHTRLRRLMTAALRARAVHQRRAVIEHEAATLLDALPDDPVVDLQHGLTFPLPAAVVAGVLGVPREHHGAFAQAAADVVRFVGSGDVDEQAAAVSTGSVDAMLGLLDQLVADRRSTPGDDLLSAMLAAEDDGTLSDAEVRANALFLMVAGHETATNMLSNALLALLRHPDQLAALRADPALLDGAVEESLRFEPAVQMTPRLAREDGTLGGIPVHAGEAVVVVLAAANRDPDVFDDPGAFAIDRDELRHVAFGHGPHWCIGGSLARAEARVVLPAVLERMPGLALADDDVPWQPTIDFRGPTRLLVRR